MTILTYSSDKEATHQFSKILFDLVSASKAHPIYIAISGGNTPKQLFKTIVRYNKVIEINWEFIHLFWVDERCVAPDDTESNYKMTNDFLLKHINLPATNIHRMWGEAFPKFEADRYHKLIDTIVPKENGLPQFDIILLGMGDDGHTASLFPHQMNLLSSEKYCDVGEHPITEQKRITLTLKVINNAKRVFFLVTGLNKADKISAIINELPDSELYPAAYVKAQEVTWILDDAAAELI